jgi:hypothetical protein
MSCLTVRPTRVTNSSTDETANGLWTLSVQSDEDPEIRRRLLCLPGSWRHTRQSSSQRTQPRPVRIRVTILVNGIRRSADVQAHVIIMNAAKSARRIPGNAD